MLCDHSLKDKVFIILVEVVVVVVHSAEQFFLSFWAFVAHWSQHQLKF